jgi:2-aminoethylphosphonate-pyruvate transaminase
MILLNPGPVTLSQRVRNALLGDDLCHREPEFSHLQSGIREALLQVYELDGRVWTAILLTGSGTSALEAMISSLLPDSGKLLVIENGVYGERLSRIAEIHGIKHERMTHIWGEEIHYTELEQLLLADKSITHLAVVHHETTTGRLNEINKIAAICQQHDVKLLLDAVSSFGAEEIRFDDWQLAAVAATANKCLHGVPGTSFVISRRDQLNPPGTRARTLYLNLASYCNNQDQGGTPFTQSVHCFYALSEALAEFAEQGGWQQRREHYRALAGQVRQGFAKLGIKPLMAEDESSCVLNAYYLPDGIDYQTLHDRLKQAGFVIYAGQGGLAKTLFRISTMGQIDSDDMQRLLTAMQAITTNPDATV